MKEFLSEAPDSRSQQIELNEIPDRVKAIHQSDLLSLFIGSAVIGYRNFKHSGANFFALGNDLDFKSKAGRFYNKISGDSLRMAL